MLLDGSMKSRLLAGLLVLGTLAAAPAVAERQGPSESVPVLEHGPDRLTARQMITLEDLQAYRERAALAAERANIEAAIDELQELLKELREEKNSWRAYERDLREYISSLNTALLLERREDRRAALRRERDQRSADLDKTMEMIDLLQGQIWEVTKHLRDARAKKLDLTKKELMVTITEPSEGARILVGSRGKLRISSMRPPTTVRIQIERRGPPGRAQTVNPGWKLFYNATWQWEKLKRTGPMQAFVLFTTGESAGGPTLQAVGTQGVGVTLPVLSIGRYRARVARGATSATSAQWRSFSVVGRLAAPRVKPKQVKPGVMQKSVTPPPSGRTTEATPGGQDDQIKPSVLPQPAPR